MTHAVSLPSIGDFDAYLKAVYQIPMLPPEEEHELILRKDTDINAAYKLTSAYLRLVVSIARRFNGYGLPMEDLVQEGNIGLMKAVKNFDPTRPVKLATYAYAWIQAEIQEFIIKNWRLVKIATTKAQRKLFFNLRRLRSTHDKRIPDAEALQIASELDVPVEELRTMEMRFAGTDVQIDPSDEEGNDDKPHLNPSKFLVDDTIVSAVDAADGKEQLELMHELIDQLPDREQDIIRQRWLVDDEQKATLQELATKYNISLERVRQLEVKAIKTLRSKLC